MKKLWTRVFAAVLAVAVINVSMPFSVFSAEVLGTEVAETESVEEFIGTEEMELSNTEPDLSDVETANPEDTAESEEMGQNVKEDNSGQGEEQKASEDDIQAFSAREVVEEYTLLTEGQKVRQTDGNIQRYLFEPEENGYYRLAFESVSGQDFYCQAEKTIFYIEDKDGNLVQKENNRWESLHVNHKSERLMWLNKDEDYIFYCQAANYYEMEEYELTLQMDKADIASVEIEQAPTEESCDRLSYEGMQIRIHYADETKASTVCNVSRDGEILSDFLNWQGIAWERERYINPYIELMTVDSEENWSQEKFSSLEAGNHMATVRIYEYVYIDNSEMWYYDFPMEFTIQRDNIAKIEVQNPAKTNFSQDFNEWLEEIDLVVTYQDNTTKTFHSSSNSEIRQYLKCSVTTEQGIEEQEISFIDEYLKKGGQIGNAVVYVEYRGKETSYEIHIAENPYERIEVTPKRTDYFTKAGYTFDGNTHGNDSISEYDFTITLYDKSGGYKTYDNWYNLPNGSGCGDFGIKYEGDGYTGYCRYIDDFIKYYDGVVGEQEVTVIYCGKETAYPIMIKENPYHHIKLVEQPNKKQYLHGRYTNIDFRGMVLHAYKDEAETDYDVYSYDEYLNYSDNRGSMTEEQYGLMRRFFNYRIGGHESSEYLELGSHTIHLFFMGHEATYDIDVVEKLAESVTVTKMPDKLSYYANSQSDIRLYGLEFESEDLKGNVKKYCYENYGIDGNNPEYGDWYDISYDFTYTSNIKWNTPGRYSITISYLGAEDNFEVTILDDPVKSFQIIKMPDKKSYYQYETDRYNIDLTGMEYQVTFKDGTTFSKTVQNNYAYFNYNGELFELFKRWKTLYNGSAKVGNNALVVSAFGESKVTDTVIVKEDPVESMTVLKNPEKMQYIGNDRNVDLYGLELQITYINGKTEHIEFTEHVESLEVNNECGGMIKSSQYGNSIEIRYRNIYCNILFDEVDFTIYQPVPLEDEGYYHAVLTEENPFQVYSFIPEQTKTYYFFGAEEYFSDEYYCTTLYEGGRKIYDNWSMNCTYNLEAGRTYYYVVAKDNFGAAGSFDCYFSSINDSLSDLTISDFAIKKVKKTVWYDFESENIWAENINLSGTEYEINYSNGWKQTGFIKYDYSSVPIHGTELSAAYKYIVKDESENEVVEKREDNALVYTFGEKIVEVPIQFNVPSPVESVEVVSSPWENQTIYEYQVWNWDIINEGLSVRVHYKDGREDETVVWENNSSGIYHNEYYMGLNWKDYTGSEERPSAITISYMGKSVEVPVTVLENPVKSIEVIRQPEKTEYYSFEEKMDLYGVELLITYKDGTAQPVKAETHNNRIEVAGKYGGELRSYKDYNYENGIEESAVYVSYMGSVQMLMPIIRKWFLPENSTVLTVDQTQEITLGGDNSFQVLSFKPSETGNYRFEFSNFWNGINSLRLYNATGNVLASAWNNFLDYEMYANRQYYLVISTDNFEVINLSCITSRQPDTVRETVREIDLPLASPVAGSSFDIFGDFQNEKCYITGYSWLNDEGDDGIADYGTAHRLMLILMPYSSYQFDSSTQVTVNGEKVLSKSISSDRKMTIYYTFPHTQCRVIVPQIEGYDLDESQNGMIGSVNYGETYKFRYLKHENNHSEERLIVKSNDTVLSPDADGYYLIEKVMGNITVITKTDKQTANEGETKLTLYNKSANIFDIINGIQNKKLAENENGEQSLPVLNSYVNGSDQFFFGWYLNKDESLNGKGTRFTSQRILEQPSYHLYAKWGSGLFSYIMNNKQVNYKILSIDENNKTKVQIGDGSNKAIGDTAVLRTSLFAMPFGARAAAEDLKENALELPSHLDLSENQALSALGIDFSDCLVTAIAENAFSGEDKIQTIKLPETIERIGVGAFENCTGLKSIDLTKNIAEIGENAFSGCESLETISIPSSVRSISAGMFQGCSGLTNVYLADGVSKIDANAFEGCKNLKTIVLPDSIATIHTSSFTADQDFTIFCSTEMKQSYAVRQVQETTGAKVIAVDINMNYDAGEKQFTYGDAAQTFTANVSVDRKEVPDREIVWNIPETSAFVFEISEDAHSVTVTPKHVTSEDENIQISAMDKETGRSKSIALKTVGINLGSIDEQHGAIYSIQEIGVQEYTGTEICPEVYVINTITKEILDQSNYDVFYHNNIEVGNAFVTVQGKGNYAGSLSTMFIINGNLEGEEPELPPEIEMPPEPELPPEIETPPGTELPPGTEGQPEITRKAQSITASDIIKTYGEEDFAIGAQAEGGILSYESGNADVISVDATTGMAKITGAGTAQITIKAPETAEYLESIKTITITVQKANAQLKTAKKSYQKVYGGKPFRLHVESKDAVQYMTDNPKVAAVKNGKVTIKSCGKAVITVSTGSANYEEEFKTITVKVVPKKAKLKKVISRKAGEITVTWKKQKEAAGYVVEYSADKKFKKKVKTVKIKKNKTTSTTIKNLTEGKKYYVRIKAFTKINKKQAFGAKSKVLVLK